MWQTHRLCETLGFVDHDTQCCCGIVCHLDTASFRRKRRGWCIIQVNSISRTYERRTHLPSTRFFLFFNLLVRRITQVWIWESHSLKNESHCITGNSETRETKESKENGLLNGLQCFVLLKVHSPSFCRAQRFLSNDRNTFLDAKTARNLSHELGVHAEDSPWGRWSQVGAKRHEQQNVYGQLSSNKGISHRWFIIYHNVVQRW